MTLPFLSSWELHSLTLRISAVCCSRRKSVLDRINKVFSNLDNVGSNFVNSAKPLIPMLNIASESKSAASDGVKSKDGRCTRPPPAPRTPEVFDGRIAFNCSASDTIIRYARACRVAGPGGSVESLTYSFIKSELWPKAGVSRPCPVPILQSPIRRSPLAAAGRCTARHGRPVTAS